MSVDTWGTGDVLVMLMAGLAVVGTVAWWVPAAARPLQREYDDSTIRAYDRHLVSYVLAAAAALVVGAVHMVVKNLPGVSTWLWEAGYGGHLVRDLSNSHIIIVGCGTVLLSGLTWYALPRMLGRPLFSPALASASLRLTVVGVFGFYLCWVVLGVIEGQMIRDGWTYDAAKAHLGAWHTAPTRLTSMLLGIGYWTFVMNVVLTAVMSRSVRNRPAPAAARCLVVAALALFVGTVQGVVQVLPAAADWIHAAGRFGSYVDPISHAHVNLITGMVVALAGLAVWASDRIGDPVDPAAARPLYWALVPTSIAFYLAFLVIGLVSGGRVVGHGGIQWAWLADVFARHQQRILATAGTAMLVGFWVYVRMVWRIARPSQLLALGTRGAPGALLLASTFALLIGTFQGLLQVVPGVQRRWIAAEEIPNAHAQLNMIGGVLLALIGLAIAIVPELTGKAIRPAVVRRTLVGVGGGVACNWAVTVASGMARSTQRRGGLSDAEAWSSLGLGPPLLLTLSSGMVLWGALSFARAAWAVSVDHRLEVRVARRELPQRVAGRMPRRITGVGAPRALGIEFLGGCAGWPGAGWLVTGRVVVGLPLVLVGPAIAWAVLPLLFSSPNDSIVTRMGWESVLVWLVSSATLSTVMLWASMRRRAAKPRSGPPQQAAARSGRWQRRAIGAGAALIVITLMSAVAIPAVVGVADPVDTAQRAQASIPEGASGVYANVASARGSDYIKLFEWSFLLESTPRETPVVAGADLRSIIVAHRGIVEPERYRMYALASGAQVPLVPSGGKAGAPLVLAPAEAPEPGDYLLDIPDSGGWERSYYYLVIAADRS